jgi:hypothetical protein
MLRQIVPPVSDVAYEHKMLTGTPAEGIVRFAEEVQADFIVMGTHGRTGLFRVLMGSVAEAVVRKAPCPVLTVRQPAPETDEKPEPEQHEESGSTRPAGANVPAASPLI